MTRSLAVVFALLLALACSSQSEQARVADSTATHRSSVNTDSVRQFVRAFYDWYTPLALADLHVRTIDSALKARPAAFDTTLARELREDDAAQAKASGELVGLDFDPVLASQDPCPRYEVGRVDGAVPPYHVQVTATCDRGAGLVPGLVAEVEPRGGGFVFVNFRYPSMKSDLRTELARLRLSRSTKPK
jgi:hypothetical protein